MQLFVSTYFCKQVWSSGSLCKYVKSNVSTYIWIQTSDTNAYNFRLLRGLFKRGYWYPQICGPQFAIMRTKFPYTCNTHFSSTKSWFIFWYRMYSFNSSCAFYSILNNNYCFFFFTIISYIDNLFLNRSPSKVFFVSTLRKRVWEQPAAFEREPWYRQYSACTRYHSAKRCDWKTLLYF